MSILFQDDHHFIFSCMLPRSFLNTCCILFLCLWILLYLHRHSILMVTTIFFVCRHIIYADTTIFVLMTFLLISGIIAPRFESPMTISAYDVYLSIYFFFAFLMGFTSSTFSTLSLVEGGTIDNVSMCFQTMITSQKFTNKAPCNDFV